MTIVLMLVKEQHGRHYVLVETDVRHKHRGRGCVIRTRYTAFVPSWELMFMTDWASMYTLTCHMSRVHLYVGFKLVHTAAWFG